MMSNQSARKQDFWSGLAVALGTGAAGVALSLPSLTSWFATQLKPSWTLPDKEFLLACAIVSVCIGIPMGALWSKSREGHSQKVALRWYLTVAGLNLLWLAAFFGARSPAWGYAISICFWLSVLAALWTGTKYVGRAALLMVPVLLWGTYTSSLNFHVLALNVLKPITESMDRDPRNQDPRFVQKRKRPEIKGDAVQGDGGIGNSGGKGPAPAAGQDPHSSHSGH